MSIGIDFYVWYHLGWGITLTRAVALLQPTKKQKLFLMLWCPDDAKIKSKMLYSSSFDALKKSLTGVAKYVEVSDVFFSVKRRSGRRAASVSFKHLISISVVQGLYHYLH